MAKQKKKVKSIKKISDKMAKRAEKKLEKLYKQLCKCEDAESKADDRVGDADDADASVGKIRRLKAKAKSCSMKCEKLRSKINVLKIKYRMS